MTERFTLTKDIEWWFVNDNTIKVNEHGYREDLTGEDRYRGLKKTLTEQETVDLLNELFEENQKILNFLKNNAGYMDIGLRDDIKNELGIDLDWPKKEE